MRTVIYTLIIILFQNLGFAQTEFLAKLPVRGYVTELGISPSGEIWMASKAGNVYFTKEFGSLWHIGPYGSLDPMTFSSGETYERINFLSNDVLIISGFIQEGGKQNFVYRSEDGGKNWKKIIFGKSSWIDAAHFTMNGKGWMSGNSQLIYYTEDYGKSWTSKDKVEKKGNLRFSTIHFNKSENIGLFGSFWNKIYRTTDNCETWEPIETPLQQGKYERMSKEDRPDIRKIRILGDNYIVNQQGKVYYSKADVINWKPLPSVVDFEVSDNFGYLITNELKLEFVDENLSKIWASIQSLSDFPKALQVVDSTLYAYAGEEMFRISPSSFERSYLLTNDIPIPEPYLKLTFEGNEYGFVNKDILRFDKNKNQWYRLMTVDFAIANATLYSNKIVIADGNLDNHYTIDLANNIVNEYKLPKSLFAGLIIKELRFEQGSQGCFHSNNSLKTYIKKGDKFIIDKKNSSSEYLSRSISEIDESKLEHIVQIVDKSRFEKVSLNDLGITENDIKEFKKFIDKEEGQIKNSGIERFDFENFYSFPGENTDFNFYRSVADSLFTFSEEEINNAFWQAYGNWSTTTDWRKIVIVFQNGKELVIQNSDDKPNYLYSPWVVDFEGLKFRTNSILFGQQIEEITNGQFFSEVVRDKNYAIFKIADYLYRKKINEK
jgi:hypothetical protein